jgi:hypothetical protein
MLFAFSAEEDGDISLFRRMPSTGLKMAILIWLRLLFSFLASSGLQFYFHLQQQ